MAEQTIVERVARALCRQTCYAQNSGGGCDACTFYLQHEVESRAAIEAMRLECDPFCPVVEAIQTEVDIWPEDRPRPAPNFVQFLSREEAVDIWNAGIDAALK